ncbi:Bacterial low temperature requirement A protein (LtrA) [Rhizoctonia solani]|uniref:Bacterial low temperature requirement A protein (LtrA) n=1 Tax=Rhizoctonia solani TaxID=456999 RepID=A0A8H7M1J5_9AGAM|nr:Bacterial low temperature requirement A protein (LtrA) [Rhizoctonia solani]
MTHRRRSSLFLHVKSPPNPNDNPTLWEHRLRQRRPISRNPFEKSVPDGDYGNTVITSSPVIQSEPTKFEEVEAGDPPEEPVKLKSNWDMEWGEQVPSWLNLFFDLAWTATFSSLTSNNKFREPWWLTTSTSTLMTGTVHIAYIQRTLLTSVQVPFDFYVPAIAYFRCSGCNHTRNYILRSPGSSELETYDIITINPERYSTERLTKISLRVITFVLAMSRVFLLIQHLRVVIYAKITAKANRLPRQLFIVPATLVISTGLFVTAFLTTIAPKGTEPYGAKIKYACWGSAVLVEMVAHIIRFQLDLNRGIRCGPMDQLQAGCRILRPLYLERGLPPQVGPTPCGLHYDASSLALECVKNQLLLVNFLNSVDYIMLGISKSIKIADEAQLNATMRPLLLQAGLSFDQEYSKLDDMISSNFSQYASLPNETATAFGDEITQVWYLRIQLSATLNTYLNYMENDTIPETVYSTIRSYQTDYNFTLEDLKVSKATNPPQLPHFGQIQEALVEPNRFHWASVFSRYTMGVCMILLLFLNIGSVQAYVGWNEQQLSRRAGVFKWIDATCVLPTLALAYAIQFIIDNALVYAAVWHSRKVANQEK